MNKFKIFIKLIRVKQWIKNGFVFAAILFSDKFTNIDLLIKNIAVFFLFSLVASTIYIINDIIDVEADKKSPKKKHRPLASGSISLTTAKITSLIFLSVALVASFFLNLNLFLVLIAYFTMNIFYCLKLKKLVIIDVMTIAFGFILRILAGAVTLDIVLSPWLIVCTGLISLYLGFGKRKNELILLGDNAGKHRKTLGSYTIDYLDRILLLTLTLTLMTYLLYVIYGTNYNNMLITFPFVIYGTFRYEYLIMTKQMGDSPEDVFTEDLPFLLNIFFWGLSCFVAIYILK